MARPYFRDNLLNRDIRNKYEDTDLVFSDEFTSGSVPNPQKWRYEFREPTNEGQLGGQGSYQAGLNQQATNRGIRADGTLAPNEFTAGKRFSAWQNDHHEITHRIENNQLQMGGLVTNEPDPTVPSVHPQTGETINPYIDPRSGREVDLRNKVYSSWMASYGIARDTSGHPTYGESPFVDPNSPRHAWRYGYFEGDFDFRLMDTPGFRQSWWLMPYVNPDVDESLYAITPIIRDSQGRPISGGISVAGDDTAATGGEIDIFEYEPSVIDPSFRQALLMKMPLSNQSDPAWGTENVFIDRFGYKQADGSPLVFDARRGLVTIGLEWTPEYLGYYVNGVEVNRDYLRVPKIGQAFEVTREMTAICGINGSAEAQHPYRADYSSGGWLWGDNVGAYQDRINADKCLISYLRVWQRDDVGGTWRDTRNTANAVDPSTPSGGVTRYEDSPAHGVRFGVPTRYSPNPTRSDIDVGDTTVSVSTTSVDNFNLRYQDGKLLWNAQGRTKWDITRINVDDINNPSDYVGTSTTDSEYDIDRRGAGIYTVTATDIPGQFVTSQPINVVIGLNSIDESGVMLPTGGTGTGTGSTSTPTGTITQGSIEAPPEAVAGVSFTLRAPLPTFANGSVANPDDYTFLWSVPTGIEIQGPSDQYECTMVMSNDIGIGERALRVPTCDVNPRDGGTPFTFNIRVTST